MTATPRLSAPYILQSQSQKEVTHNAALNILDTLVQAALEDKDLASPPASPADGAAWIVAASPTGAWAGHAGEIAQFIGGAWAFHAPREGFSAWLKDEEVEARYTGAAWVAGEAAVLTVAVGGDQIIGARQAAIADASGGVTVDAEARAAINALLAAARAHGLIGS